MRLIIGCKSYTNSEGGRAIADSRPRPDLAQDYQDMAGAYQGLGYLESGITEPLNRFAEKMLDFSALLRHMARHCLNRYHITNR